MKRVLIVDDAIDLGRLLQDALKFAHPNTPITVVPSAEEALLEVSRFKFDLLVTDLRLPGMSGLELIQKIRVRLPEIKIILITALMPEDRLVRQKDDLHPDVFMRKPISVGAFLEAVEGLIGSELLEPVKPIDEISHPPDMTSPDELIEQDLSVEPSDVQEKKGLSGQELTPEIATHSGLIRELDSTLPGVPDELAPVQKITGPLEKDTDSDSEKLVTDDDVIHLDALARLAEAENREESEVESVSSILMRVRSTLAAKAVILLDERGNLVEEAGDLPDQALKEQLIPAVMAATSAGSRVAYLFGDQFKGSVQAYRGNDVDVVFAPSGQHVLLIVLNSGKSALRLALAFEEALVAQSDLLDALNAIGLIGSLSEPMITPDEDLFIAGQTRSLSEEDLLDSNDNLALQQVEQSDLEKLEELIERKTTQQLKLEDANEFWDSASSTESKDITSPGILSFDQAQKLGLVDSDEVT